VRVQGKVVVVLDILSPPPRWSQVLATAAREVCRCWTKRRAQLRRGIGECVLAASSTPKRCRGSRTRRRSPDRARRARKSGVLDHQRHPSR